MTTQRRQPDRRASADSAELVYRLDRMTQVDVPDVSRVERNCFPNPWPTSAYRRELQKPAQNFYVVLRAQSAGGDVPPTGPNGPRANGHGERPATNALPRRSLLPIGLGRRHENVAIERGPLIGFAGMWMAFDEAHITTIGIEPRYRGHGLGELLLLSLIDEARKRFIRWLTLEVRVSNVSAQALYRKYGFTVHGSRKRYYSDNNEDALIMWSRSLADADFTAEIEMRRASLQHRLGQNVNHSDFSPFTGPTSRTAVT
ncbi:MAG: ribosomal protein S18-alanine N-acetyltransferase [Chloroflexia bacterium]|nr:ribosomal protein S18-alanine N-acetyltransferase [Chloroflexia bacterium]